MKESAPLHECLAYFVQKSSLEAVLEHIDGPFIDLKFGKRSKNSLENQNLAKL